MFQISDDNPPSRRPVVTYAIILAHVGGSVVGMGLVKVFKKVKSA